MIEIGSFRAKTCTGINRRAFVKAGLVAPVGATLAGRTTGSEQTQYPKAKSVILLWLWGGPSHLDTFDPKPLAPVEYRGAFSTIATRTSGMRFTELFPKLAARSDQLAVIRSHKTHDTAHCPAGSIGLTGTTTGPQDYGPNFGSIVSRLRRSDLPPFISIGRGQLRDANDILVGHGGGKWGSAYDPFRLNCSDNGKVDIPALKLLDGLSPARLYDRRLLLRRLDELRRHVDSQQLQQWGRVEEQAYQLLASAEGRNAFDLSRESNESSAAYGQTAFGKSCLLARRLAEAGVPYIQVNWSEYVEIVLGARTDYGWDTHEYNFEYLSDRHGPILDRAMSALLDDLGKRGMLDSTLVVAIGEFGRTPRLNAKMARDHWSQCYCSLWAGAGVQGGRFVGESDRKAENPLTEPITPDMVGATILQLAGISAESRAEFNILQDASVIEELF